jgi:thioredoxin 1
MVDLEAGRSFDEEVVDSSVPVIVDFHADWCGPCKLMAPIFAELADDIKEVKFVKVNTDDHEEAVEKYNIQGLPLFAVFKDGKVVASYSGAISREPLRKFIFEHAV